MEWVLKSFSFSKPKTPDSSTSKLSSIRVLITGAAGQIAYSLIPLICSGDIFGREQHITLHLHDISVYKGILDGISMEITDCAYPNLVSVLVSTEMEVAFKDVDVAFILAGAPKREGLERKDLVAASGKIVGPQGKALSELAKPSTKVLVVSLPALSNALIIYRLTNGKIPASNISALIRQDQNRARTAFASFNKVPLSEVDQVTVWGNRSTTAFPDVSCATIRGEKGDFNKPQTKFIEDFQKLDEKLATSGQKLLSPMAFAKAAADHMRDWWFGTNKWVSVGILSENNPYKELLEIDEGTFFGFPCTCSQETKKWEIVKNLKLDEFARNYIDVAVKELSDEKTDVDATVANAV